MIGNSCSWIVVFALISVVVTEGCSESRPSPLDDWSCFSDIYAVEIAREAEPPEQNIVASEDPVITLIQCVGDVCVFTRPLRLPTQVETQSQK